MTFLLSISSAFLPRALSRLFILNRAFNLSAGLRYDLVSVWTPLSPRINLSYEIVPRVLNLRGGYGITAKAPTASYLHPNNAYCDQTLFNNDVQSPQDKIVIASTRIFDTSNSRLEMAKNRKLEVGLRSDDSVPLLA